MLKRRFSKKKIWHKRETICWELHWYSAVNHNEIIGIQLNVGFLPKTKKSSIIGITQNLGCPSSSPPTIQTMKPLLCPGGVWPVPIGFLGGQGGPLVATLLQDTRGCQMSLKKVCDQFFFRLCRNKHSLFHNLDE